MSDTDKITALRPFTDDEAIAWLRERGKLTTSGAQLAKQFGWQERKAQRKLDDWRDAGLIKREGKRITVIGPTKSDTPDSTQTGASGESDIKSDTPDIVDKAPPRHDGVTVSTLAAALALATVSAGFSVTGLTAVFVGATLPVIAMGVALEVGKLAAVTSNPCPACIGVLSRLPWPSPWPC